MNEKIKAMFIFEILGRPKEYVKEALEEHINNLEKFDGIKILNKKIHEPKELDPEKIPKKGLIKKEDAKDIFTSFAEVELEVDNLLLLFSVGFRLLPSHIEIIEPDELRLKNFDLSAVLSELAIKLHRYDEVAKILTMENQNLARELEIFKARSIKVEEVKKEEKEVKKDEKKENKDEKQVEKPGKVEKKKI